DSGTTSLVDDPGALRGGHAGEQQAGGEAGGEHQDPSLPMSGPSTAVGLQSPTVSRTPAVKATPGRLPNGSMIPAWAYAIPPRIPSAPAHSQVSAPQSTTRPRAESWARAG